MVHFTRLLPIVFTLAILASGPVSAVSAELAAPASAQVALAPLTSREAHLIAEVHARFALHGLPLPADLRISFHDDSVACGGNLGRFDVEEGQPRVKVCWNHGDPFVQNTLRRQALVHEAAHAWVHLNTDDATRHAFVELTASSTWSDRGHAWEHRGTERAAELITGIVLDPAVPFIEFETLSCEARTDAYELLTGHGADFAAHACAAY